MKGLGLMLEVQVAIMLVVVEELVQKLVDQFVVVGATTLVVGVSIGTHSWDLLALAVTMHQRLTGMLARALGNMVSKKHESLGLAIGVVSSLYPSPSSCY